MAIMSISISCDECAMQSTDACEECVVTFVLRTDGGAQADGDRESTGVLLDLDEQRVLRWFSEAGLVPDLRFLPTA